MAVNHDIEFVWRKYVIDQAKYLWLLVVTLVFPLQSFLVLSAECGTVEGEVDSLLLVDVGTIELVEDDDEDWADIGGGKIFGLTGYLWASMT